MLHHIRAIAYLFTCTGSCHPDLWALSPTLDTLYSRGSRTEVVFGGSHLLNTDGAGAGGYLHHLPVAGLHVRLGEDAGDDLTRAVVAAALPAGVQNPARADHAVTADVLRTIHALQLTQAATDGRRSAQWAGAGLSAR